MFIESIVAESVFVGFCLNVNKLWLFEEGCGVVVVWGGGGMGWWLFGEGGVGWWLFEEGGVGWWLFGGGGCGVVVV